MDSLSVSEKSGAFWYLDRFGYSDPTVVQGVFQKDMSLREAIFMIQPLVCLLLLEFDLTVHQWDDSRLHIVTPFSILAFNVYGDKGEGFL